MRRYLKAKFVSISDAEEVYGVNYFDDELCPADVTTGTPRQQGATLPTADSPLLAFSPLRNIQERRLPGSVMDVISSGFTELTVRQRQQLMVHLFKKWLILDFHPELNSSYVPSDLLPLLGNAMKVLFINGKNNVMYHASRCFGELRPGENTPRMPLSRMPFGLIAHNLRFFASDNTANLEAPADYKSWYQTMYTLFGNKWAALHSGPMWSYTDIEDDLPQLTQTTDILTAALQQTFGSDCSDLLQPTTSTPEQMPLTVAVETPTTSTPEQMPPTVAVETPTTSTTKQMSPTVAVETPTTSTPEQMPPAVAVETPTTSTTEQMPLAVAVETPDLTSRNVTSHLWTSMNDADRREQEGASLTLPELEEMHGIRPSSCNMSSRDRNPLNVRFLLL